MVKKKKITNISEDFDDLLMEFEEESNEAKYWFTDYKMTQIEKLHDYLNSLEETGKVLSFATILKIGRSINNGNSLDSVQLGLLYEKLPQEYKEVILIHLFQLKIIKLELR